MTNAFSNNRGHGGYHRPCCLIIERSEFSVFQKNTLTLCLNIMSTITLAYINL